MASSVVEGTTTIFVEGMAITEGTVAGLMLALDLDHAVALAETQLRGVLRELVPQRTDLHRLRRQLRHHLLRSWLKLWL